MIIKILMKMSLIYKSSVVEPPGQPRMNNLMLKGVPAVTSLPFSQALRVQDRYIFHFAPAFSK